ncbi:MAG: enoyl-CoA hydratase/isomerase family protein [Byssovorax sp.]
MSLTIESVGDALVVTIDRPKSRNAIDHALAKKLGEALRLGAKDPKVRGIVLAARGPVFLSGGDLKMLAAYAEKGGDGGEVLAMFDDLVAIEEVEVPVIAAVQGDVFGGGCELILLCDMVIAESHTAFAFRHAKMGLSPAWGGLSRLVERVGPIEAARLLYTAERVSAHEALRIGLVNDVVDRDTARAAALARVGKIADNPRTTVASLKKTLRAVRELGRGEAMAMERAAFSERWNAPDHRQAMNAVAKKE